MHRLRSEIRKAALIAILLFFAGTSAHALTEGELRKFFEFGRGTLSLSSRIPAWAKQDLVYASIGDISPDANPIIDEAMKRLSSVTGLNIRRGFSGRVDITFISDPKVLLDLHDRPRRFRSIGLSDEYIVSMQTANPRPPRVGGESCASEFFTKDKDDTDILTSISLSQSTSKYCVMSAALTAIGVNMKSLDDERQALRMACILYRAHRIGARTMTGILDKSKQLEPICDALERTN